MPASINPSYLSRALAIPFKVPTAENTIYLLKGDGTGGASAAFGTSTYIMYARAGSEFLDALANRLTTAYNSGANYGSGGSFTCRLSSDCRIVITNNSDNDVRLATAHASFTAERLLGAVTGGANITIPGGGGEVEMVYQPPYLWAPHMFHSRDSGPRPFRIRARSRTLSRRPHYVNHSAQQYERIIAWDTIGAAFMVKGRSSDAVFAESNGCTLNDPNCSFQEIIDYLDGTNTYTTTYPYPGRVVIISDYRTMEEAVNPTTSTNRWYIDLPDEVLNNISDDSLFGESGLESYKLRLVFRRET